MRDSDGVWRRWGEIDPYYGVLACERFHKGLIDDNRDEFFALGEGYVAGRLDAATRYFGPFPTGRALDFGCGVGRLTLPLARRFEQVVGLDIAPAMLEEAGRNAAAHRQDNADFRLSDDRLSAADGLFDFVLTCIVLQHIPVPRGMAIIHGLLERVAEGGVAAVHVSVERKSTRWRKARYWARMHIPGWDRFIRIVSGKTADDLTMQMNEYPLGKILDLAAELGFGPAMVTMEWHGAVLTAHVLCRRERLGRA